MNVSVRSLPLLPFALACLISLQAARAQTSVSTNPVGYVQLTCSAGVDTTVAVPFQQPAAYVGLVAAVSGSVVTVSGTPAWTSGTFVYSGPGASTYYAQFGPNSSGTDPLDGSYFTVVQNGTNTLTLNLNSETIDGSTGAAAVTVGSSISIIPYWTLATVFPPSTSGTYFIGSASPGARKTQILVPDYGAAGTNNSPTQNYYFWNTYNEWALFSGGTTSYNDLPLPPDGYIIVRNPSVSTTLTTIGTVLQGNLIIPLSTSTTLQQDNFVGICRPVSTTLNQLGLGGTNAAAFVSSASQGARKDQLLVWSGSFPGENVGPDLDYYYQVSASGTGWRLFGGGSADHGNDTIPAGAGFIIRKATSTTGNTAFWQNPAPY